MAIVVLLGTLDTKGVELDFVRSQVRNEGCEVILVDVGVTGVPQAVADIGRDAVAEAAGVSLADLVAGDDRGAALDAMARGAARLASDLHAAGRMDCLLSLGGSGGSSIATAAMRVLPIGVPKLMVSTVASSDVSSYVGQSDITMMYSVLDVSGLNAVSRRIYANAAAAAAGMARSFAIRAVAGDAKSAIAITMFGVTTPAVTTARHWLESLGYEVLVFHANGAGGRSMEKLAADGALAGVLDLTTTELADELVGGDLSAGPQRLEAAGRCGLPQVVSLGALDMVNFGPFSGVPARFGNRVFYKHNANVTLMRTTPAECIELGRRIAGKLNAARGPVCLFVPRGGVSSIAEPGKVFFDPAADIALIEALTATLSPSIEVVTDDASINDPAFATAMARKLHTLILQTKAERHVQS